MGLFDSLLGNTSTAQQENTNQVVNFTTPGASTNGPLIGESSPISPDNAMDSMMITLTPTTDATLSLMGESGRSVTEGAEDLSSVLVQDTSPSTTETPVISTPLAETITPTSQEIVQTPQAVTTEAENSVLLDVHNPVASTGQEESMFASIETPVIETSSPEAPIVDHTDTQNTEGSA